MKPLRIALDFDGVVHEFTSPFTNSHEVNDDPVPGALAFIRRVIDSGGEIVIHTARANTASVIPHVHSWLAKHGLEERYAWTIEVTALKPEADVYIDDRAWRFEGSWPEMSELEGLKPWNKREPCQK